jgi:hypothetical protein
MPQGLERSDVIILEAKPKHPMQRSTQQQMGGKVAKKKDDSGPEISGASRRNLVLL